MNTMRKIEIMANNGPICKGLENDNGNIFEPELWKKSVLNGAFLKSLSILLLK